MNRYSRLDLHQPVPSTHSDLDRQTQRALDRMARGHSVKLSKRLQRALPMHLRNELIPANDGKRFTLGPDSRGDTAMALLLAGWR